MNRRYILKSLLSVPVFASSAHGSTTSKVLNRRRVSIQERFEAQERQRTLVELVTGRSTWEPPLCDFEWAVIEHALASADVSFHGNGDLNFYLFMEGSDFHTYTLTDVVERTCELMNGCWHPDDVEDVRLEKRQIAAALRAAADQIERA